MGEPHEQFEIRAEHVFEAARLARDIESAKPFDVSASVACAYHSWQPIYAKTNINREGNILRIGASIAAPLSYRTVVV